MRIIVCLFDPKLFISLGNVFIDFHHQFVYLNLRIADGNEILQIIKELSIIMSDYDFNSWMKYIDPESLRYWSNPRNLLNASKRLPSKTRLSNLNDYFRYVFVPSRKGRSVEEIRYISRDSVKAVQPMQDRDIVYYNFVRINGKWMVNIPELQN